MARCKRRLQEIDPRLFDDLMEVSAVRQVQFKERKPKERSFREMTKILRTAPSYKSLLNELKTLPRRKKY